MPLRNYSLLVFLEDLNFTCIQKQFDLYTHITSNMYSDTWKQTSSQPIMQTNPLNNSLPLVGRLRFVKEKKPTNPAVYEPTHHELAIKERAKVALRHDIYRMAPQLRQLNDAIESHPAIFDLSKLQDVCCHTQPNPWYAVHRTSGCIRSRIHMNCDLCKKNVRIRIVRDRNNWNPVYAEYGYLYTGTTFFSKEELLEAGCMLELEGLCKLLHNYLKVYLPN